MNAPRAPALSGGEYADRQAQSLVDNLIRNIRVRQQGKEAAEQPAHPVFQSRKGKDNACCGIVDKHCPQQAVLRTATPIATRKPAPSSMSAATVNSFSCDRIRFSLPQTVRRRQHRTHELGCGPFRRRTAGVGASDPRRSKPVRQVAPKLQSHTICRKRRS
jgi:hypothetical protein